jgi:hypothetical protein
VAPLLPHPSNATLWSCADYVTLLVKVYLCWQWPKASTVLPTTNCLLYIQATRISNVTQHPMFAIKQLVACFGTHVIRRAIDEVIRTTAHTRLSRLASSHVVRDRERWSRIHQAEHSRRSHRERQSPPRLCCSRDWSNITPSANRWRLDIA